MTGFFLGRNVPNAYLVAYDDDEVVLPHCIRETSCTW